ncbi:MAG TPA: hypothetical protein VF720_05295, partial [Candidatus Eisenbacteria bacterium]
MPPRRSWLAIIALSALLLSAPLSAEAAPFDNRPKILLHLTNPTTKNACDAGRLSDCTTATTAGDLAIEGSGPFYFAYVLTAKGNLTDVAGLQFGLNYQDGLVGNSSDGVGLDIFQWVQCATYEFAASFRPWPEPGGSNLIVWNALTVCQTGETGVAGYFYMGAYGPDALRLTPRPIDGLAKLANCLSIETILEPTDLGIVAFGSGSEHSGCNACLESCGPPIPPPDTVPPDRIVLSLGTTTSSTATLQWPAPDEDGPTGYGHWCRSYDMRQSTVPITETNFTSLNEVTNLPNPTNVGFLQSKTIFGLVPGETNYFAIRAIDDGQNAGPISNVIAVTTSVGPDVFPPAAITDLAIAHVGGTELYLEWTAPGDDEDSGQASRYDIRYSLDPITASNFGAASQSDNEPVPGLAGTPESFVLSGLVSGIQYYVAMKSLDEVPNSSALSNVVTERTIRPTTLDTTPPAAITDLIVTGSDLNQVHLEWTATGDD